MGRSYIKQNIDYERRKPKFISLKLKTVKGSRIKANVYEDFHYLVFNFSSLKMSIHLMVSLITLNIFIIIISCYGKPTEFEKLLGPVPIDLIAESSAPDSAEVLNGMF